MIMAFVQTDYQFLMQNLVQDTEVKQEALLKENLKLLTQKKGALEFTNQAWQKKKKNSTLTQRIQETNSTTAVYLKGFVRMVEEE